VQAPESATRAETAEGEEKPAAPKKRRRRRKKPAGEAATEAPAPSDGTPAQAQPPEKPASVPAEDAA
jgi:hypothetical protein